MMQTRPTCKAPACKNLASRKETNRTTGRVYYRPWCNRHRADPTVRGLPLTDAPANSVNHSKSFLESLKALPKPWKPRLGPMPNPEPPAFEIRNGPTLLRIPYRVMRALYLLGPSAATELRSKKAPGLTTDELAFAVAALFTGKKKDRYAV